MSPIPLKLRKQMSDDPYYTHCARQAYFHDHECQPNPMNGQLIEWEHALKYAGKQINEIWAIIPICWWAHRGGGLDKRKNEFLALKRATIQDLNKYPRQPWLQKIKYLNKLYENEST